MKDIARYFFQIRLKLNEPDKQKKELVVFTSNLLSC